MMTTLQKMTKNISEDYKDKVCDNCNEKIYKEIKTDNGGIITVPTLCSCGVKKREAEKKADANREKAIKLRRLKEYSLMDKQFEENTFENFKIDKFNKRNYKIGKRYCEKWQKMKEENIGLLLHGIPGVGKTYLSNCIANELLNQLVAVMVISPIGIINRIYDSYGKYGEKGEAQIIKELNNADLLIIDDLGAEHKSEKAKQIIYSIIDSRSRSKKPIIVTTNYNPEQLQEHLRGSDGIARSSDRLFEICTPIEIKGRSNRVSKMPKKQQIVKRELLE